MTRWLLFIVIMWHCGKVFALWKGSGVVGGEISRKALVIKSALSDMLFLSDVLHGTCVCSTGEECGQVKHILS